MKIGRKILTVVICMLIVASTLVGCDFLLAKDKEFSTSGMTITLTTAFSEKSYIGYTAYYQSFDVLVFVLKEEKTTFPEDYRDMTVAEYAELLCGVNSVESNVMTVGNYAQFSYTAEISGEVYYYYARCYKTADSFWMIQFACFNSDAGKLSAKINKWADTISFGD